MIDGRLVEFSYTDNNIGEDLIIHTTQENYMNWAGSITVYYSVLNNSGQNQMVKTTFSLNDGSGQKKYVKDINEYDGEETIFEEKIIPSYISSTTNELMATSTTITEKTITQWAKHNLTDFVLSAISNRKDIKNTHSLKNNEFLLAKGETKFFKAEIAYTDFRDREEFFIEAFGSLGAYGHLDPWTYEQLFNILNTADLHGQDSWSGDVLYDVTTDAVARYEGAKGVKITVGSGITAGIFRSVTGVGDGLIYVATKKTNNTSKGNFAIYEGANYLGSADFLDDGKAYLQWSGGTLEIGSYNANTWIVFALEFRTASNEVRAKFHDGTSWSAWSDWKSAYAAFTNVDKIRLWTDGFTPGVTQYWDTITPTNPAIGLPPATYDLWIKGELQI